ncbi:MAG: transferase [Prosthecochloris sp.]|nr:transferase [Prosthecochloris sp.]
MQIIIFEDSDVCHLAPLTDLKPACRLYTGGSSLYEKFLQGCSSHGPVSFHMRRCLRPWYGRYMPLFDETEAPCDSDILLINSRLVFDQSARKRVFGDLSVSGRSLFQGGRLVAARYSGKDLPRSSDIWSDTLDTQAIATGTRSLEAGGFRLVSRPWDLIAYHPSQMQADGELFPFGRIDGDVRKGAHLVCRSNIRIADGAVIHPGAVLDASDGYIAIGEEAVVEHNAVLAANVILQPRSRVKAAARIYSNVCIGVGAKAGGEIEDSVMEPFSNKQHDGFLGHSYISSWCNLGAGTITSDLRNDYKSVRVEHEGVLTDTDMQFLGLVMGEHSKSAIGSVFNTGTIAGTSSNIFGAGFPPKSVPSFSWGGADSGFAPYDVDRAVETARRVMRRRNIDMDAAYEEMFRFAASCSRGGSRLL